MYFQVLIVLFHFAKNYAKDKKFSKSFFELTYCPSISYHLHVSSAFDAIFEHTGYSTLSLKYSWTPKNAPSIY